MNRDPKKYDFYKRFMDNKGDVKLTGFNAITGKPQLITGRAPAPQKQPTFALLRR